MVSISAPFRRDGWVEEANDFWPTFTWEIFKGTPMETEYKRLSPTPNRFPDFVNHIKAMALRPYDFGDQLKATKAPMFCVHGDAAVVTSCPVRPNEGPAGKRTERNKWGRYGGGKNCCWT